MRDAVDLEQKFHFHDGNMTVQTTQDCTPILEDAKRRHNEGQHGSSEMRHAARIPNIIVEKYCIDKGLTFHEVMSNPSHIKFMLNDPDLSAFRIWRGRV